MRLKRHFPPLIAALLLVFTLSMASPVAAASLPVTPVSTSKQAACEGLSQVDSDTKADCSNLDSRSSGFTGFISGVVNILSIIVGIVAVIMVVVSGLRFITSGGDSAKVASAKSALVYALIGIAVTVLAQFLVHYVFNVTKS